MNTKELMLLLVCLALAVTAGAEVTEMALDHDGTLYRIAPNDGTLTLSISPPENDATTITVPGAFADAIENPLVAFDEHSGTVILVWQANFGDFLGRVEVAAYQDGTWFGPKRVAGDETFWATNPALEISHERTVLEDGTEITTEMVHIAWWHGENDDEGGWAMVRSFPLEDGQLLYDQALPAVELRDLVPYGIACSIPVENSLNQPRLFVDPETGDVHVLFIDIVDCRFGISRHSAQLAPEQTEKRRRHISSWRHRIDMPFKPQMALVDSKFDVGHNLSVVMYWDVAEQIEYATLNPADGWSDIKSLSLTDQLDHEQAVELIRHLAK